jgi:predicted transcriptional regulator
MSPGSGDAGVWPIEQQQELFGLMGDVRGAIGVELTPSCLMIPNKTISGIRFTTETGYRACQVCRRERCPSRSAPFDHDLWEEAQVD